MTWVVVHGAAQLMSALASAQAGEVIALAPGNYGNVKIQNFTLGGGGLGGPPPQGTVTIKSLDANRPAWLSGLFVDNSSNLNFSNLVMSNAGRTNFYPFEVYDSQNINFTHLFVHGTLGVNPAVDKSSFMVRNSSNVSITGSDFEYLENGIAHLDSQNLNFSDNTFENIQSDGIHGGGSSNMTISGNSFTNFYPLAGDHPDAVQFFTRGTSAAAQNIVIEDNTVTQGIGGDIQGIFLQDETGVMPFQNVTIANNTILGGLYNGIAVFHADNLAITGNDVVPGPDMTTWIRVEQSDGVKLDNNIAAHLILSHNTNLTKWGNQVDDTDAEGASARIAAPAGTAPFVAAMAAMGADAGVGAHAGPPVSTGLHPLLASPGAAHGVDRA